MIPDAWKHATVRPIFKNRGTADDPLYYRPVSLLPAQAGESDRIQSSSLLQHLVQQNLISPQQFGFIPGKSTAMQLVYLIQRWLQALEKGHNITAIFLGFEKAFDRVWHHGLLHKLLTCSIHEHHLDIQLPNKHADKSPSRLETPFLNIIPPCTTRIAFGPNTFHCVHQ